MKILPDECVTKNLKSHQGKIERVRLSCGKLNLNAGPSKTNEKTIFETMWWVRLLSRLPWPVLYGLADALFVLNFYVIGYRRKVVQANLKRALPELSGRELKRIERDFFRNLADYGVETLKLQTMTAETLCRRMRFKNPEFIQPFREAQQPFITLASHHFNWEWLIAAAVPHLQIPWDYVFQAQPNTLIDRITNAGRSRFGAYPIRRQVVAREALKRKNEFRGIAIVGDQFPGHLHDKRYWTEFLGQDTAFFQGINQLAVITQYPVLYAALRKIKRGYYEMEFIPLAYPPYAKDTTVVIDRYIAETEKAVRQRPAQWLWSHKRWKKDRTAWGDA
jgi:KDO2-lipid IV(A) lauroyltransferase